MNTVSEADRPGAHARPSDSAIDKSEQSVRRMFGEIAPHYDRMNHLLSMNVDRYWRWRTVRRLAPQPGDSVLDVCTGTGDLALAFGKFGHKQFGHKRGGRGLEVQATDFCPEMLEIARQKNARARLKPISFSEADVLSLPFESGRFDLVTAAFGLRNVSDTDCGLTEMTRVCKPGGRVAVLEFSQPRRWPIRPLYEWYFKCIVPRIGQRLAKNSSAAYEYLPESVSEFPAYEALTERMRLAGLQSATYYPLTFGIATLYVGVK